MPRDDRAERRLLLARASHLVAAPGCRTTTFSAESIVVTRMTRLRFSSMCIYSPSVQSVPPSGDVSGVAGSGANAWTRTRLPMHARAEEPDPTAGTQVSQAGLCRPLCCVARMYPRARSLRGTTLPRQLLAPRAGIFARLCSTESQTSPRRCSHCGGDKRWRSIREHREVGSCRP
jgi:hypothetical protein